MNIFEPLLYGCLLILSAAVTAGFIFILMGIYETWKEKREKRRLEWGGTHDFIDSIPVTKKKRK